jgi:hypothetical protein
LSDAALAPKKLAAGVAPVVSAGCVHSLPGEVSVPAGQEEKEAEGDDSVFVAPVSAAESVVRKASKPDAVAGSDHGCVATAGGEAWPACC